MTITDQAVVVDWNTLDASLDRYQDVLAVDFTPTLGDYEDFQSLTPQQKRVYAQQVVVLQAYSVCGTILKACVATKVVPSSVYTWLDQDRWGFKKRWDIATRLFVQQLEDRAYERIKNPSFNGRIGSDGLLSHALNAHSPRWRGPQPAGQEQVGEVMKAIIKLARPSKAIEGQSRALDAPEL